MIARARLRALAGIFAIFTIFVLYGLALSQELLPPGEPAASPASQVAAQATESPAQPPKDNAAPPAPDLPTLPPTRVEAAPTSAEPFPGSPNLPTGVGVTPNRMPTLISQFGGSVSVIDSAQIVNSQQSFLRDLLQTTPGLTIAQNGGPGRQATVFLRGQSSRATKVLVDGIPINDPSTPQRTFDFGSLNALEVERVEVLRGPQSTLYGADAVGGVINIITKRGEGPLQGSYSSMGGRFGTYDNQAHISGGTSKYYYSFGADSFYTSGFSVADQRYGRTFDTENDLYRQNTLATRFGWTPDENFDVDVVLRYLRSVSALDSFNQAPFDLVTDDDKTSSRNEQFYGRIATRLMLLDGFWENRVAYNRYTVNRDFSDPNSFFPPTLTLSHGSTDKFEYQANLKFGPTNLVTLGTDYLIERFDNPPVQEAEKSQTDTAFYAQDQISLWDRWFTTLGIRRDDYELAGPATTWRTTSVYHVEETETAFHGAYGTGFIAPSLFELFADEPPFVFGNPKLKPEHARGFEYGVEQGFFDRNLTFDVTYFRTDSENLIEYIFPTYENIAKTRASGVELITTVRLDKNTSLTANYTNTSTLDIEQNRLLQLIPRHQGSLALNRSMLDGKANWYMQVVAIGDRFDYSAPEELQHMPPHAVVNTAMWYDIRPNIRLFARADNLFNTDYEEIVGYGTPRFSLFGGVKITFGGNTNDR